MKKLINILVIIFIFFNVSNSYSQDFKLSLEEYKTEKEETLIDLKCEDYIDIKECKKIYSLFKDKEISAYNMAKFDNQLRKIASLIRKGKESIAQKKYNYFIEVISDELNSNDGKELLKSKEYIWNILVGYSNSEDYNPNIKYK